MQLIPIDEITPGMILAKNIYREKDGRILLRAKAVLNSSYIQKIKSLNYDFLYILDPSELTEENDLLSPIKEETKIKAIETYKRTVVHLKNQQSIDNVDIKRLREVVKEMVDQILGDSQTLYNLIEIKSHDDYTFNHSINVATISILTGAIMGLSRNDLELLGIGALLHDIGKTLVDKAILNKPGKLDPAEFEIVKEHARNGYDLLKTKISTSFLPAHVALQHHEREDGSGYPRGINGKSIHQFSKIVAVADVYDAMTSKRPYHKLYPPIMALQELVLNRNTKFNDTVVDNLTRIIAPYPIGSVLLLSNGEIVTVTSVTRSKCLVKVIEGIHQGQIFNLYQLSELTVVNQIR